MGMALVEDNLFDKGYEDELSIAQRDWAGMQKRSLTQGYRAGVRLQAAFYTAYTRAGSSPEPGSAGGCGAESRPRS